MIDLHHHLIYGVDDGARDIKMSCQMIRRAVKQGVTEIVCTSHTMPGHRELNLERYVRHVETLRQIIKQENIPLQLHMGAEVLCTSKTAEKIHAGEVPVLGNSWNVLLEFRPDSPFEVMRQQISDIVGAGYGVVLAHAERYGSLREGDRLIQLKDEFGIMVQMNASTVLGTKGLFGERWSKRMLREGVIDVVASDAHNVSDRACSLGDAYDLLERTYGLKTAKRLCDTNPAALLK